MRLLPKSRYFDSECAARLKLRGFLTTDFIRFKFGTVAKVLNNKTTQAWLAQKLAD